MAVASLYATGDHTLQLVTWSGYHPTQPQVVLCPTMLQEPRPSCIHRPWDPLAAATTRVPSAAAAAEVSSAVTASATWSCHRWCFPCTAAASCCSPQPPPTAAHSPLLLQPMVSCYCSSAPLATAVLAIAFSVSPLQLMQPRPRLLPAGAFCHSSVSVL